MGFKSGFISIIGRPNVGKSTLANTMIGNKVSIVTSKPQTTRNTIRSILTTDEYQMVFIDTPGIHKPKNKLGEYMVDIALETLNGVDVVLFMIEADKAVPGPGDLVICERLKGVKTPVILVINKIDLVRKNALLPLISTYEGIVRFIAAVPVSSINGEGFDDLKNEILNFLPEGPLYFPDDMVTDQPEHILAAEIIREKLLIILSDEVPYGTGIEITNFEEKQDGRLILIRANIYCERKSHKSIIIGKNGSMLKKAGTLAREELEMLLGTKIFLELWVKIKEGWRNDIRVLKTLGYN
jgi:GTP-binding protein Era